MIILFITTYVSILKEQLQQITLLEFFGVLFGVMQVLYARANKIWLYPFGIVSVTLTVWVFFNAGLYAEMTLQFYYLIMSIYGWMLWSHKGKDYQKIKYSTVKELRVSSIIVIFSWGILYYILFNFTDSDVPFFDSLVSAFAWAGMWLLAKRKIENWVFLNISNIIAIPLLYHKGLILYCLLTIFLFIIAILGYRDWKKEIGKNEQGFNK